MAAKGFTRWVKDLGTKATAALGPAPSTPLWNPAGQPYPRLIGFDPVAAGLVGQAGLFAIWHLGVRPQWLKTGASADLAATVNAAAQAPHIVYFQPNGGVYLAWAQAEPAFAAGAANFLAAKLLPVFGNEALPGEIPAAAATIDVPLPPGVQS